MTAAVRLSADIQGVIPLRFDDPSGAYVRAMFGPPDAVADFLESEGWDATAGAIRACRRRAGPFPRDVGYIDMVFVPPSRRGQGLGQKVMKTALGTLRRYGVGNVYLVPIPGAGSTIVDLIRFYRKLGFADWKAPGRPMVKRL